MATISWKNISTIVRHGDGNVSVLGVARDVNPMKTTDRNPLAGLLLAILALTQALSPATLADDVRSYSTDEYPETLHNDWMKWVPDDTNLTEMSLPGTHDTMSLYGGGIPETQSMKLRSQLNAGIRVIDI